MEQVTEPNQNQDDQIQIDSWEAAFAALEQKDEKGPEATADAGDDNAGDPAGNTGGDSGQGVSDQAQADDGSAPEAVAGGPGADDGGADQEDGSAFGGMRGVTEESIRQYEEDLGKSVRDKAIEEIAKEFVKRGIRNNNGVLGATMDDSDICKRDEDGVPHFYNPETGQEFRGDNPRRQAQEWVDDYNKELARVFNNACEQYEKHLMDEAAPKLAVMKFAPKYEKLDDIRKGMFDNVVEDYEIKDSNGDVIGYSCDLDKALALVERQINMIQGYAKQHQQQQKPEPQQPLLDMKTSSGAVPAGNQEAPTSLAEALERVQDQQLAKMKR